MDAMETTVQMLDVHTILDDAFGEEPLVASFGRALDEGDLAIMASGGGAVRSSPPVLQRLRARHHALAKALAQGMRPGVAAATFGYSASRVSILQGDTTFQELVAHYKAEADHDYARIQERLTGLSIEAIDELEKRLEEEPKKVTNTQLMKLIEISADRTGHGPKATQDVNVNVGFADRLREARKRVQTRLEPQIIDVTPEAAE